MYILEKEKTKMLSAKSASNCTVNEKHTHLHADVLSLRSNILL